MTSIIIAHRFDTIRNCDKIVVIDDSRIVESGNYNELINKKGMFYELK
jgi:ABC-type dipeptide/oligopeptide/nickel transport system ATPase component